MFDGGGVQGKEAFKIMKFKTGDKVNEIFTLPTALSAIVKINPSLATKTRTFNINCFGESSTLKLKSNPDIDKRVIENFLNDKLLF